MSPILSSQGVVLATAMAVSGTVILLALRLQKSLPNAQIPRSCITSEVNKREKRKNKNRKVRFAEDVVDPSGDGEAFRRQHCDSSSSSSSSSLRSSKVSSSQSPAKKTKTKEMPANRVALYNGILRDRRPAYSC